MTSVPSSLLSYQENQRVFSMFAPRSQSLATAVAQMYTARGPNWNYFATGVVCLVKDNELRSFFFRLFSPISGSLIWEQEVYHDMLYLSPKPFLHTFEAEDCIVGFNFADVEEASCLRRTLMEKLEYKKKQLERRLTRRQRNSSFVFVEKPSYLGGVQPREGASPDQDQEDSAKASSGKKKKGKKEISGWDTQRRKKLSKKDIGNPMNFKHVSHVGWTMDGGFDYNNVDPHPQLKAFLEKAGVSETAMKHKETREFIYKFIEQNGGMDAVTDDLNQRKQPSASQKNRECRQQSQDTVWTQENIYEEVNQGQIPVDSRRVQQQQSSRQQHQLRQPRQPVPPSVYITSPGGNNFGEPSQPPPPPPPIPQPPPPQPPPPPPRLPLAPPPPLSLPESPKIRHEDDPRSNLLQEIRQGKTLKHVGNNERKETATLDSRNQLMGQIRTGVHLKSAPSTPGTSPRNSGLGGGLAGALAKALQDRTKVLHSDSSAGSQSSEDDEEWKD